MKPVLYRISYAILCIVIIFSIPLTYAQLMQDAEPVQGPISIVEVTPKGQTSYFYEYSYISVTFNQPMVSLEARHDKQESGPLTFDPPIAGKYLWQGDRTLIFYPEEKFIESQTYTCTIPKKTRSEVTRKKLKKPYSWKFNTPRIQIVSVSPNQNAINQDIDQNISISFNQPVYASVVKAYAHIRCNNKTIEFTIIPDKHQAEKGQNAITSFTLIPHTPYAKDAMVRFDINAGLRGVEGNLALKKTFSRIFHTFGPFVFLTKDISIDSDESTQGITLRFSTPICRSNLASAIKLSVIKEGFGPNMTNARKRACARLAESQWSSLSPWVDLYLLPLGKYKLTITACTDVFGQPLQRSDEKNTITITVASRTPYIHYPTGYIVIEAYEQRVLPIRSINYDNMVVSAQSLTKRAVAQYFHFYQNHYQGMNAYFTCPKQNPILIQYTLPLEHMPEQWSLSPLHLDAILSNQKPHAVGKNNERFGTLYLQYKNYDRSDDAFVQITSLGLTGRFSPWNNRILVTSLKTAAPLSGIHVSMTDPHGKVLSETTTDSEGIAAFPSVMTLPTQKTKSITNNAFLFFAEHGNDMAFIATGMTTGIEPWRYGIYYDDYYDESDPDDCYTDYEYYDDYYYDDDGNSIHWRPYSFNNYLPSYCFTERGLYRSGDTVHCTGLVRNVFSGTPEYPLRSLPLDINVETPVGKTLTNFIAIADNRGYYHFDIHTENTAARGKYTIYVSLNNNPYTNICTYLSTSASFRIEDFREARMEASLSVTKGDIRYGDSFTALLKGSTFSGTGLEGSPIDFSAQAVPINYRPPGEYCRPFSFDSPDSYTKKPLIMKSDSLGKGSLYSQKINVHWSGEAYTARIDIIGTIYGDDEEQKSAVTRVIAHAADAYPGIALSDTYASVNHPINIAVVAADKDGHWTAGSNAKVTIVREWQNCVQSRDLHSRLRWNCNEESETVYSETIQIGKKTDRKWIKHLIFPTPLPAGKALPSVITYTPKGSGYYTVTVSMKNRTGGTIKTSQIFYVYGDDYFPWSMDNTERVRITPDREHYNPGDTARLFIMSPYETATAYISIERERIITNFVTTLKSGNSIIEIPIRDAYIPNVYVSVSLLRGRVNNDAFTNSNEDLGKPEMKIGYHNLNVSYDTRTLRVLLTPEKDTVKPGEKVTITGTVVDHDNNPVSGTITFAVCDEGVLSLIGYKTPNPIDVFYQKRGLSVISGDLRSHIIGNRNYGQKEENPGGSDAEDNLNVRTNFQSTAFFKAVTDTDEHGAFSFTFTAPDNLTAYRIMAIASSKKMFGNGEKRMTVNKPLMLMSTMPNFIQSDDVFSAGALVYNQTKSKQKLTVRAQVSGGLIISGSATKTITLKKGAHTHVPFTFKGNGQGDAVVTFSAYNKTVNDAFRITIPAHELATVEWVKLYETSTQNTTKHSIIIPSSDIARNGYGSIEGTLAPSIMSGMKGSLHYLQTFPHDCLEQRFSKIYPFVEMGDFLFERNLTTQSKEEINNTITAVINAIPDFVGCGGYLKYWTDSNFESPWLTAYGVLVMAAAQEKHFSIPKKTYNNAIKALNNYLNGKKACVPQWYINDQQDETQSYIAYALARAGKPRKDIVEKLIKKTDALSISALGNLLRAAVLSGFTKQHYMPVRQALLNYIINDGSVAHFEHPNQTWCWYTHDSPENSTAIDLQAFAEANVSLPVAPQVARWLVDVSETKRTNLNTQTAVNTCLALYWYTKRAESNPVNFTAAIQLDKKKLAATSCTSINAPIYTDSMPLSDFKSGKKVTVSVNRKGSGRLYYSIALSYKPSFDRPAYDAGYSIEKWITDLNGSAVSSPFYVGQELIVRLKITAHREGHFIALTDPLVPGFRIINPNLQAGNPARTQDNTQSSADAYWWWGQFDRKEYRFEKYCAYASYLPEGEYTMTYHIKVATPGTYSFEAAHIEDMYHPALFGTGTPERITILPAKE